MRRVGKAYGALSAAFGLSSSVPVSGSVESGAEETMSDMAPKASSVNAKLRER